MSLFESGEKNIPETELSFEEFDYRSISNEIWNLLEKCSFDWDCYPFESIQWVRLSGERLAQDASGRLLVVRNSAREPVAFWTYALQKFHSGGVLPIVLCHPWALNAHLSISVVTSPKLDLGTCTEIVRGFFALLPNWNKMLTGMINVNSNIHLALIDVMEENGRHYVEEPHEFAEIRGWENFEDFLQGLSHDWRRKYKRIINRYVKNNTFHVEHIGGNDALPMLEELKGRILGIYKASWKADGADQRLDLNRPDVFARFSSILQAFAERSRLHVTFTKVNGDDAAFYVGVHYGKIYCSLQTAYKEIYAPVSVGFYTQLENFRYTIENGFVKNNLLANQPYKKHLTDARECFSSFVVYNNNPIGIIARRTSGFKGVLNGLSKIISGGYSRQ